MFEQHKKIYLCKKQQYPIVQSVRIVQKRAADGGRIAFADGSNCAIEVGEAFEKNPEGVCSMK
jgi:hypothetical protein